MKKCSVYILIAILFLSFATTTFIFGAEKADCETALAKCLFSYTFAVGLPMAIALCGAGYAWCLQFLN